MTDTPEKVDLKSMSITDDQKAKLKQLFPEVFNEDKIDFDKLRRTLGEEIDEGEERFGMTWPGKNDSFRVIQEPSIATLKPCKEESVGWDNTENLFIEGDNLEVLKLLQRSYYGKIKMIYIDPPYNTGNQFIYPDKYSESLETYLAYTGQVDAEGVKFSTNTEAEGRFHSKWMNMMYPRLFLARNLLREDGVILISIDDNEISNLLQLCNEVFGENNKVAQLVWKKKYTGGKHAKHYVDFHEYILVYAKCIENVSEILMDRPDDEKEKFTEEDEYVKERGKYYTRPLKSNLAPRPTLVYPIELPDGNSIETQWLVSKDTFMKMLEEKRIELRQKLDGTFQVYRKYYEKDGEGKVKVPSLIDKFPNTEAKYELKKLFDIQEGRDNVFYTVKPKELLKYLLRPFSNGDEIIMDFFAGSATLAQSIYELNCEDFRSRKYLCVQLPEVGDVPDGFENVADIGKERIRRVINKIREQRTKSDSKLPGIEEKKRIDLGFRVFKLDKSNFNIWDGTVSEDGDIEGQLELAINHIDTDSSDEDILYEILLRAGFELTTKIKELNLADKKVYSIADNALLICLERNLTKEVITEMSRLQPARVVCLDVGFADNDQLKTNAVQIMKSHDIEDFRTV